MTRILTALEAKGVLSSLDRQFAVAMGRIANETSSEVLLAAALVSRELGRGHVCLDMESTNASSLGLASDAIELPEPAPWIRLLQSSSLVGGGDLASPLVLDADNRLYLHRYWQHERQVAAYLLEAASSQSAAVDDTLLLSGLDRLFPASSDTVSGNSEDLDYQRIAALVAVERKLCVISGGPGTGKTSTVVKILALLIEQAIHEGREPPTITLVAPTGKAAARLVESIRNSKSRLPCSAEVTEAIPDNASTLHRCLGSIAGSSTMFRHNKERPLSTDIVLVDEASMVDLGMMRRLVDALPKHARLILIGDMDQLASVDAGAVLGDICNAGGSRSYSHSFCERVSKLESGSISPETGGAEHLPVADSVVRLSKSYRFGDDSGIAALANAINAGDSSSALKAIDRYPELRLIPSGPRGQMSDALRDTVVQGYTGYLQENSVQGKIHKFDDFRVLCARRSGNYGVVALNELIESELRRQGLLPASGDMDDGRPILISANNYQLDLFNGDIGLVLGGAYGPRAHFLGADGKIRSFSPGRLGKHESVYAMSVHKSQGSEFKKVAIVLPETMSSLMTREIIYTAVTRAKESVEIHGSAQLLARTIEEKRVRRSGLRSALWGKKAFVESVD